MCNSGEEIARGDNMYDLILTGEELVDPSQEIYEEG